MRMNDERTGTGGGGTASARSERRMPGISSEDQDEDRATYGAGVAGARGTAGMMMSADWRMRRRRMRVQEESVMEDVEDRGRG